MKYWFSAIFILITCTTCNAQKTDISWEEFVLEYADETDEDNSPDPDLFDLLYEIHSNPINLNTTNEEELSQLPFLSDKQVKDILFYIENNYPMKSLGELMFIRSLDKATREKLHLFCHAGEEKPKKDSLKKLFQRGKSELTLQTDIPFYRKAGYQDYSDSILERNPNKVYRGSPLSHSVRYKFSSSNRLFLGINMEKDAGERGIDYISGYLQVKDVPISRKMSIKNIILGKYRLSLGQGLIVNSSSTFGKAMSISSLNRTDKGISPKTSNTEYGYFTGAATTIDLGFANLTAFYSYNSLDGTMRKDSLGISSIITTGLHRTNGEYSKKGNIHSNDFGASMGFQFGNHVHISTSAVFTLLDKPLMPVYNTESTLYRFYNLQGKSFEAYSMAYKLSYSKISFTGETAISHIIRTDNNKSQTGFGTINTLQYKLNNYNTLTTIFRSYGAKFATLNGKTFSENSIPQNETGLFIGWSSSLTSKIKLDSYADFMHFPWLKYQTSGSTNAFEGLMELSMQTSKKTQLSFRYRIKSKQKDNSTSETGKFQAYSTNHNSKLRFTFNISPQLSFITTCTSIIYAKGNDSPELGYAISQNASWKDKKSECKVNASISYFSTESFDSKVYYYEPTLHYSFGFIPFYYKGIRTSLLGSVPIHLNKKYNTLFIICKLGITNYFNRNTIGSGTEEIKSNHREDIQIQAMWKF